MGRYVSFAIHYAAALSAANTIPSFILMVMPRAMVISFIQPFRRDSLAVIPPAITPAPARVVGDGIDPACSRPPRFRGVGICHPQAVMRSRRKYPLLSSALSRWLSFAKKSRMSIGGLRVTLRLTPMMMRNSALKVSMMPVEHHDSDI